MSEEIILHSGEFTDRFDNNYRVTFYKKDRPIVYVIYSSLDTLEYTYDGVGPTSITVWSYEGQAIIDTPESSWFSCVKSGEQSISGSDYKKYTYTLEVSRNSDSTPRTLSLVCKLEDIPETTIKKDIQVYQDEVETVEWHWKFTNPTDETKIEYMVLDDLATYYSGNPWTTSTLEKGVTHAIYLSLYPSTEGNYKLTFYQCNSSGAQIKLLNEHNISYDEVNFNTNTNYWPSPCRSSDDEQYIEIIVTKI